ncbi:uncharacterized protein MONBRDRAFT_34241 [Monosiga brevicollis MX1]|uniref:Metallo-beta-lactamase domain-containing protein n=1 Tax=Monosiga brevicollis TaxID=81824 RepID=A9VAF7_MONBE|nr:uncharacterized protein MONBRDRAFT_34241 [Monosiga brevicollis MX1]EDQ85534.1 predicted protein [Monosiga brevicollis MX1]|eukprot:XP_001749725.1 hypothetical protein [Monosiga brevicollis MX1]
MLRLLHAGLCRSPASVSALRPAHTLVGVRTLSQAVRDVRAQMSEVAQSTLKSTQLNVLFESADVVVAGRPTGALAMNQYMVACKARARARHGSLIFFSQHTKQACFIDAGESPSIFGHWAATNGFSLSKVLLTHGHPDHVAGLRETIDTFPQADVYLHEEDQATLSEAPEFGKTFDLTIYPVYWDEVQSISDGDVLQVGNLRFECLHTPGHCAGHVCFYERQHQLFFAGDTLFKDTVGRTDLPGGNRDQMHQSLVYIMSQELQDNCVIFPGHMATTTFGRERRFNLFLKRPIAQAKRLIAAMASQQAQAQ